MALQTVRMDSDISYFARTNHRNAGVKFGIRQKDRMYHMYAVGQTGVGKSTLLATLAMQDLMAGRGFALIDPHGDLVHGLWNAVPDHLRSRVTYLNAPDLSQPYGYNPLRSVRDDKIPLAVSGMLETLRKMWPDAWGVRMEHVLRNSLYALLEREDSRLPDILRLYRDEDFRKAIAREVRNKTVRRFWQSEFANYPWRLRTEAVVPIQNKLGALLSDPMLYRILVQPKVDLHFRALMDEGRVLLVNLSKGQIGEDSARILGGLLVSTIGLAALTRADVPAAARKPFFLFVDEFHAFTTLVFVNMLSELRKYGCSVMACNQFLQQIEPDIRHAVLGNVGTIIAFRVGPDDARHLASHFQPKFEAEDLLNIPNHRIYLKLMIDGVPSQPFSATTISAEEVLVGSGIGCRLL